MAPETDVKSEGGSGSRSAAKHRVSFGSVQVTYCALIVDGSKLPTDGVAPLGLGPAIASITEAVDEFDRRRRAERRGVLHLGAAERRQLLAEEDASAIAQVDVENLQLFAAAVEAAENDDGDGGGFGRRFAGAPRGVDGPFGRYSTASAGDVRTGSAGGFAERDAAEEERRRERAEAERLETLKRKAERRKCDGCRRFSCIC